MVARKEEGKLVVGVGYLHPPAAISRVPSTPTDLASLNASDAMDLFGFVPDLRDAMIARDPNRSNYLEISGVGACDVFFNARKHGWHKS